jgi:hypothetical protein
MPVIFRNNSLRPAPQVSLSKSYAVTGDGRKIGTSITARLAGTIVAEKVDDTYIPLSIDHRLSTLLAKQKALRDTFGKDGLFEVQGFDASPPVKFYAIVDSVDFSEGPWTDKTDYTISLHSAGVFGEDDSSPNCDSVAESWTFEEGDLPRSWKATHSLSAKGKLVYDAAGNVPKPAWQYARDFVNNRLGVGWTTVADPAWSLDSGQALASGSAVMPSSTNAWNRAVSETVDEAEGAYSLTESWTLSPDPWVEEYTISVRRVDDPPITTTASISGTIHGLRSSLNDPQEKYLNAALRWNTVKDLIAARCQARVPSGTLNTHPTAYNVDHDEFNGTIQYQADFDDRAYINNTFETYSINQTVSEEDYKTIARIEGTITGAVYLDDGPSHTIKYTRASLQWSVVKSLIFARVVQETGIQTLKPFPVSAQVTSDRNAGTITYSYEFSDQNPASVRHEYTISRRFSREDGADFIGIEGTITGLRTAHSDSPFGSGDAAERYANALTFWDGISGNLLGVAATYVDFRCINPNPVSTNVGHSPLGGTITYSSEFSSAVMPTTPGALSETVSIQDEEATPLIAIIPVLGRPLGPVIQDLGSIKERRRTVTVEVVMIPAKFGCSTSVQRPDVDVGLYVPQATVMFKEQDTNNWVPNTGRYTRTVSWIYE